MIEKLLNMNEFIFKHNYLIHIQTKILNGEKKVVGYFIMYIINPTMLGGAKGPDGKRMEGFHWMGRNYSRIVITDTNGTVIWSAKGWCRAADTKECAGKRLKYNSDILALLEVDTKTITEKHFAEKTEGFNKDVFEEEFTTLQGTMNNATTVANRIEKTKKFFDIDEMIKSSLLGYGIRTKNDAAGNEKISKFILYIVYIYMSGKIHWKRLNKEDDIETKLNKLGGNLRLGHSHLVSNKNHSYCELDGSGKPIDCDENMKKILGGSDKSAGWVARLLRLWQTPGIEEALTKVVIDTPVIVQEPISDTETSKFGYAIQKERKKVLKVLSRFGITFRSRKFAHAGRNISNQRAYLAYANGSSAD